MVIQDGYAPPPPTSAPKVTAFAADPFDRFSAQILDLFIVVIPLCGLILAPLSKDMSELYLTGEWTKLSLKLGYSTLLCAMVFCLYHGLSTALWGKSLGKKLLRLEVRDLWEQKSIGVWMSVFRSFYLLIQFLALGMPLLLILVNRKHRGLHDQISETWVVSLDSKPQIPYRLWPVRFSLRISLALFLLMAIPLTLQIVLGAVKALDLEEIFSPSENAHLSCSDVNTLEEGMALVATGSEDVKCLKPLVEAEFLEGGPTSSLAYLVKSFLHVEDAELSDQYLDQVCKTEAASPACLLSQVISAWSAGDMDTIDQVLSQSKELDEPYLDLWALRYFQQAGRFQKSLALTERLKKQTYLQSYVLAERAKALFFVGQIGESDNTIRRSKNEDLIAWGCQKRLDQSCENVQHEFCQVTEQLKAQEHLENFQVLLGQMKIHECANEELRLGQYLNEDQPEYWKTFVYGIKKDQRGDHKSAWSIWKSMARDTDSPDYLKAEAIRRMLQNPEISEIESLGVLIGQIDSFEYREQSTLRVAAIYRDFQMNDLADSLDKKETRKPASVEGKKK